MLFRSCAQSRSHCFTPVGRGPGSFFAGRRLLRTVDGVSSVTDLAGRGDALLASALEAMYAGLPPLVPEWTGSKAAVERVDEHIVVPLEAQQVGSRIELYLRQDRKARSRQSQRARKIAPEFSKCEPLTSSGGLFAR
jgi:hypothetical protein